MENTVWEPGGAGTYTVRRIQRCLWEEPRAAREHKAWVTAAAAQLEGTPGAA